MKAVLYCDIDSTVNDHWRRIQRNTVDGQIQPVAWSDEEMMKDQPLPGAVAGINRFYEDHQVTFLTSRYWTGAEKVTRQWLDLHGFHYDRLIMVSSHHAKLPELAKQHVDLFIDDFGYGHERPEPWPIHHEIIEAMPCPYEVFNTPIWENEWRRIIDKYYRLIPNGEHFWQMARRNLEWWRSNEDHERTTRGRYYDNFCQAMGLTRETLRGRTVAEIGAGPFGGLINHLQAELNYALFIDVLANAQRVLRFIDWPADSSFADCPMENICIPDKTVDVMLSYNAMDHGWDVRAGLDEVARTSRECYLAFDCKADTGPPHDRVDHYQTVVFQEICNHINTSPAWAGAKWEVGDLRALTPNFHFEHNWDFPIFYCHARFV